ncbi:type I-C CRISPR-associated protein Cas8c/Csd1 [Eubacterium pyruvativorans]|uniref:type I-C CRISPR-associated protein Cas8c/Csd1 n=1 Tax=Eubacterium pyruvativorans TaxID=155865 RepID=UPI003F8C9200
MLRDVYNYGIKNNIVQKPNTAMKRIDGYICIDEDGEFDSVEKGNPGKIPCPDIGPEKQGCGANAIVDKAERIVPPEGTAKTAKKHKAWLSLMQECCRKVPEFKPLKKYLESLETDDDVRKKLKEALINNNLLKVDADGNLSGNKFLTFKIEGESIVESGYWENWLEEHVRRYNADKGRSGTGNQKISSITGETVSISKEHKDRVKGGVFRKGANLKVSYDSQFNGRSSFDSYGMERGLNSAIGDEESVIIADTLNYLGSSKRNSSKQFGIIYWYSDSAVPDLIGETLYSSKETSSGKNELDMLVRMTPSLSSLYEAALKGTLPEKYPANTRFKIFKATNSQERYSTRESFSGEYGALREGIFQWYKDTAIDIWENPDKKQWRCDKKAIRNIYSVLFSLLDREQTADGPLKESRAEYGDEMLRLLYAIYSGCEIPEIFFYRAVKKGYTSILLGSKFKPVFIQVIKVYLTRKQGGIIIMEDATVTGKEPKAYSCGRLFAVYGRIQKVAANFSSIGNDVCSRYIGMMFKHPDEAFVEMAKLSFAHMKNIENKDYFAKIIAEITSNIGTDFPQKFTKTEQAEFLLGYYRQLNSFIEAKAGKGNSKNEDNNVNNTGVSNA